MNMNLNPTREDLQFLLAGCDDDATDHRLVVRPNGDVEMIDARVRGAEQGARFWLEIFHRHNDWTGCDAAADIEWVDRLLAWITCLWESGETGYSDLDPCGGRFVPAGRR